MIDGVEIQIYQRVNHSSASNAGQNFNFGFTATSAIITLGFRHKPAGEHYSFLSGADVFVISVPKRETCTLILAGLGLVGFVVCRRPFRKPGVDLG